MHNFETNGAPYCRSIVEIHSICDKMLQFGPIPGDFNLPDINGVAKGGTGRARSRPTHITAFLEVWYVL